MKVSIGSDHAGYTLKEILKEYLKSKSIAYEDFGTFSNDSVDYPDFGHAVAKSLESNQNNLGIVICGSGNGINMTVNKYPFIRAALCWTNEIAELAKLHNNANVLTLPARFIEPNIAIEMVNTFINTPFEGGRHELRVNKINTLL